MVRRSYEEFRTLDAHLHQCIYDRRYSQLLALPALCEIGDRLEVSSNTLEINATFISSLCCIASTVSCSVLRSSGGYVGWCPAPWGRLMLGKTPLNVSHVIFNCFFHLSGERLCLVGCNFD